MKSPLRIALLISSLSLFACESTVEKKAEKKKSEPTVEMVASHAFLNVCVISSALKISPRNAMSANAYMKTDAYLWGEEIDEETGLPIINDYEVLRFDQRKFKAVSDLPARVMKIDAKGGIAEIESGLSPEYWCAINMYGGDTKKVVSVLLEYFEKAREKFHISQRNSDDSSVTGLLDIRQRRLEDVLITMQSTVSANSVPTLSITAMPKSLVAEDK